MSSLSLIEKKLNDLYVTAPLYQNTKIEGMQIIFIKVSIFKSFKYQYLVLILVVCELAHYSLVSLNLRIAALFQNYL